MGVIQNTSATRTIAKNTLFNFIATASDVILNLVVGIVLARGLGSKDYGLYSFVMWFLSVAVVVANLGLGDMAKRFVAEAIGQQNKDTVKGIVRLALSVRVISGLVVSLVVLGSSGYWASLFLDTKDQIYFVLLAFMLLPSVLNNLLTSIFAGFQKYEYGAYLMLGTNPLRAALVILFMAQDLGVQEVLMLSIATSVLGVFIGMFLLSRLMTLKALFSQASLEPAAKKGALKYSLTMAGTFLVTYVIWHQAEVLFLGLYRPVEEVGFYTLACKIPTMAMTLIPLVFAAVLLPSISEQFGRKDLQKVRTIYTTSSRYLMMLAFLPTAAGISLARPIVSILYGAGYEPVVFLMQIVFVPLTIWAIAQGAAAVIWGINQPSHTLKVGLILAGLNIGFSLWLIPNYGMLGAAIGSSVPRLLALPIYIGFLYRRIGAKWPLGDTAKIVLASAATGLALFALESQLSPLLSLLLAIPVGLTIYLGAILGLRVIHSQDITVFRRLQNSLSPAQRKYYATILRTVERIVEPKSIA